MFLSLQFESLGTIFWWCDFTAALRLFTNMAMICVPSCWQYLHQITANLDGKGGWTWTSYPIDINCGHCHQLTI